MKNLLITQFALLLFVGCIFDDNSKLKNQSNVDINLIKNKKWISGSTGLYIDNIDTTDNVVRGFVNFYICQFDTCKFSRNSIFGYGVESSGIWGISDPGSWFGDQDWIIKESPRDEFIYSRNPSGAVENYKLTPKLFCILDNCF